METKNEETSGTNQTNGAEEKAPLGARITYRIIYGICWTIGLLPTWFLYNIISNIIYFLIYHVAHYRIHVVRTNLETSFPEKSKRELRSIERKFYAQLAEIFIDTIDATSMSDRQLARRLVVEDVESHIKEVGDKNWIAALAHYGSWEYFMAYSLYGGNKTVGVYRPLHSKAMDMFYKTMRSRFGMKTVSMKILLKYLIRHTREGGEPIALGLIADQTPRSFGFHNWINFLNHPTGFYRGMDQIATKLGMPVYFVHINKVAKSHYRVRLEMIYDGVEKVQEDEITARYAVRLEEMIRLRPELWMWSHKRWKHTPDNVNIYERRKK